jgi:bifunctional protein TilS/HprT
LSKERDYFRAIRRATAAVNSEVSLKEKLDAIIKSASRAARTGASLILLDTTGKKLVHSSSWGLPNFYIQKGLLDPDKSLSEVLTGKAVAVSDVSKDPRIQYPEMAKKAKIVSMLGVPVMQGSKAAGTLRLYSKVQHDFSGQDITFVSTMADLAAVALSSDSLLQQNKELEKARIRPLVPPAILKQAHPTTFAHPSEEDFAHLLDFYNIPWIYEPRAFPLEWEGERVTEMFAPDFYLPAIDLYVELTTMKQKLVTIKNHKLRRIRELYPGIKITLLYNKDYEKLLAKFGAGPLSQARAHGIRRVLCTTEEIQEKVREMAKKISADYDGRRPLLVGAQRGFICFMADLMRQISIPLDIDFIGISDFVSNGDMRDSDKRVEITKEMVLPAEGRHIVMVEDIVDTGITLSYIIEYLREKKAASIATCVLLDRKARRIADVKLDYVGFEIPDEFVVGYGLDFMEEYRNLPFIGVPILEKPELKKAGSEKPEPAKSI